MNNTLNKSDEIFEPRISVITVVYNGINTLERTIKSVQLQTYSNIEYLIIDGNSTDGTQSLIKKYDSTVTKWISEPDNGLYEAMNKGMNLATGDYLWFINSGDEIAEPDTLAKIFSIAPAAEIYYGETIIIDSDGKEIGLRRLRPRQNMTWRDFKKGMLVSHQSIIVNSKIAPPYNVKFRFSADFEWVLTVFKQCKTAVNTEMVLSKFLEGGLTGKNIIPGLKERYRIMVKHFGFLPTLLHHFPIALNFIYFIVKYRRF